MHQNAAVTKLMLAGRALFFLPSWPEVAGSAAGVRTDRLIRAFEAWGCRVTVASAQADNEHASGLRFRGTETHVVPLNNMERARDLLDECEPDLVVFDRFYVEEALSHVLRSLRPKALRILDMQDCHALRMVRQRRIEAKGCIAEAVDTRPKATDAMLARELASIHRSDLTLACSPVEYKWLRDTCGVPAAKLALAPFFIAEDANAMEVPPWQTRTGFVTLGTFRHPPNVDSLRFLTRDVWPLIRKALPAATCTIIGSHPTHEALSVFHAPASGLHVAGHLSPSALSTALRGARVLLAPLRFGAGLKGKVVEAWSHGTPVVTTPIGAEGLQIEDYLKAPAETAVKAAVNAAAAEDDDDDNDEEEEEAEEEEEGAWGGLWHATDAEAIARDAVRLHKDEALWHACSHSARRTRGLLFDETPAGRGAALLSELRESIEAAIMHLDARRDADYVGAALWHHRQRSTQYFSKWIEAKNRGCSQVQDCVDARACVRAESRRSSSGE
jgi:glycosyltransferase involved in cell wall biosynthesis